MAEHKRRNYLVDRKLQLSYSMVLVIQASIITLFLGICLYWINREYLNLFHLIAGEESFPKATVTSITNEFMLKIAAILALNGVLLLILGIYSSHKLAGPVYRLTKYINNITSGIKTDPLRFRKTDQLKEVADAFNQMIDNLDREAIHNREIFIDLKQKIESLVLALKNTPDNNELISNITSEITRLLAELNQKK